MATLRRQIGIRTATVNLPGSSSAGPAILKTASTFADQQFAKIADQKQQEAQVAAAAINFERDGEGNLVAPTLPVGENGLIAPSIYDRSYTEMVGQRYLQQTNIDTSERLNMIATENQFDPSAYREIAESYVAKVTEIAPDRLKPDVNNTAQIKMVEHYNMIIRKKAERDHQEARGMHARTIEAANKEMVQYVESGASPEIIGAKMLEVRALIEQGDAFNFWLDDEKASMLEDIDRSLAVANILTSISSVEDDPLAHAKLIQQLSKFSLGEGSIQMVDESGNVAMVPINEIPLSPAERDVIAKHAISVLNIKEAAFSNLLDNRVKRKTETFMNWYSKAKLVSLEPTGPPLDMDRLYAEYDAAHEDVLDYNYDDSLRELIRGFITLEFNNQKPENMSQWRKDFIAGAVPYEEQYKKELLKRLGDRDMQSLTVVEQRELEHASRMAIGNYPGGNKQSADGAREINDFYGGMTGRDMSEEYFSEMIADPNSPQWSEFQWNVNTHMSKIGIWSDSMINSIVGRINAPEGMNQETLDGVLRIGRILYDNPTFRNNMTDSNALGHAVGGVLDRIFRLGGQRTPSAVAEYLKDYSDPQYSPHAVWNSRSPEDRDEFREAGKNAIRNMFIANWRTAWRPTGLQTSYFDLSPFDKDLAGIPLEVETDMMRILMSNAGFIDSDDSSTFGPFIQQSVRQSMHDFGYAPSQMGYSKLRHGGDDQFFANWTRPDAAIVSFPPEYFGTRDRDGNLDRDLMKMVREDFQVKLDTYGKERGEEWVVDKNAALQYNGPASVAFGYPVWEILLIKSNGAVETLTKDGRFGGDVVLFDMQSAEIRNEKRKVARSREQTDRAGKTRLDYQSGGRSLQLDIPFNRGTAQ